MHAMARLRGSAPGDNSNDGEETGAGMATLSRGSVSRGGALGGDGGEARMGIFRGSSVGK